MIATAMVTARVTLRTVTTARPRRVAMSLRPSTSVDDDDARMAMVAARERRTLPPPPLAALCQVLGCQPGGLLSHQTLPLQA